MAALHRAGLAREYDTVGSTSAIHYDQQSNTTNPGPIVPQVDDRDGTRADPARDRQTEPGR